MLRSYRARLSFVHIGRVPANRAALSESQPTHMTQDVPRWTLSALATADQNFVAAASNVTASNAWGESLRLAGIQAMSAKADWELADVQRLQTDPTYAARFNAEVINNSSLSADLATIKAAQDTFTKNLTNPAVSSAQNAQQFKDTIAALKDPIFEDVTGPGADANFLSDAIQYQPSLLSEAATHAVVGLTGSALFTMGSNDLTLTAACRVFQRAGRPLPSGFG